MTYQMGVDIVVVGYHQPVDCREFHGALCSTLDRTPWDAWYVSVEATQEDIHVGDEVWGTRRHRPLDDNCGHAAACNLAAPWGNHDTIFFCNADTRLPSHTIDICYETLWSDPSFGVVGPRQIDESGRLTAAGIFGTLAQPQHRAWHRVTREFQDLRTDAVMVSGALYMIKRYVWDELAACPIYLAAEPGATGAMPKVSHYYSDTWPSYHMTAHGPAGGYKSVYEGRVTARHDWHKASSMGSWVDQQMRSDKAHFQRLCDAHGIAHD